MNFEEFLTESASGLVAAVKSALPEGINIKSNTETSDEAQFQLTKKDGVTLSKDEIMTIESSLKKAGHKGRFLNVVGKKYSLLAIAK